MRRDTIKGMGGYRNSPRLRPRNPRKIATRVLAFLLLGAIVNVAVAWACGWLMIGLTGAVAHGFTRPERPHWYVTICRRPGAIRLFGLEPGEELERLARDELLIVLQRLPRWSRFNTPPCGEVVRIVDDARGWPMVSLRATFILQADSLESLNWTSEWRGGIPLPPHLPANSAPVWDVRALPLVPIWVGFAINTIFYAAILWLLFAGPGALHRWRRLKRGLCPACAYPIGTSDTCSECGNAIEQRGTIDGGLASV
ncbi:MAG: hypothetical protein L0Y44_03805 [Phycisphaerales bacterium]|nr:hypothetical protein [Phycisphaerales bacterium]MCI0629761.1 hypothetical protein [Phycisphaerales bacterium]MCI0676496.1 hypothetical protein [Phycisphaerales bacterium]